MSTNEINPDGIPNELRERPQWHLWRFGQRGGRTTKIPFSTNGVMAKVNDAATWTSYPAVLRTFNEDSYDGIAFVFTADDEFFGIDLDACRNPETGQLTTWAQKFVDLFATYTEVSPSGFGVKLVARGKIPNGLGRVKKLNGVPTFGDKAPEIAIYDRGRFWCMTGRRLDGAPETCEQRQDELERLLDVLFVSKAKLVNRRAGKRAGGSKFEQLLRDCAIAAEGQRSERDFALCAFAVRNRLDRAAVWLRVQSIGKFAEEGERYFGLTWERAEQAVALEPAEPLDLDTPRGRTDVANAGRFALRHGRNVRWCEPWRKWLAWDGQRWAIDAECRNDALAKDVVADVWKAVCARLPTLEEAAAGQLIAFARNTASARGIANMLTLAKSEPGIAILPTALDTRPWLLNCPNGTLDLRTGQLREHCRDDYLTKVCPVAFDPTATCPNFESMLSTIMANKAELIKFLQRAVGYSLTGSVEEQVLFLLWGTGANGKSTFLNALLGTLGPDYAMQAPDRLLMVKRGESHPTERADLYGKRLVSSVEVEDGQRLDESLIKQLTGGDLTRARRMREDFWEFPPTHKLWMAVNHKPVIRGTDHAIWRRVKLVPFVVTIPDADQDKDLPAKLAAERPGILAWVVRGCLAWQQHGLSEPAEVRAATAEYRTEMDVVGAFLVERCIEGPKFTAKASAVYEQYSRWCESSGEYAVNQRRFGQSMTERGFERYTSNGMWYRGLKLVNQYEY